MSLNPNGAPAGYSTKLAPLLTRFTKAAKQLRLSTARISEEVRNLEER